MLTPLEPRTIEEQRALWREKHRRRMEQMTQEERRALWRAKYRPVTERVYRKNPVIEHATHCGHCSAPIVIDPNNRYRPRKYCTRACASRAAGRARDRQLSLPCRRNYRQRDQQTLGLTMHHRSKLLARWRRQHRTCAYCPRPASTIDHVVPLIRGGTHWEGNLAPSCRPCNSSKADQLLTEWRPRRRQR